MRHMQREMVYHLPQSKAIRHHKEAQMQQNQHQLRRIATTHEPISIREAGSGPPALFLHGWGGSSRYWLPALELLAQHRRVVAIDLPGFGATPPNGSASFQNLAKTALACADALEYERFAVVGHSLGAGVALLMAAAAPERIERLGLVSFGTAGDALQAAIATNAGLQFTLAAHLWGPWMRFWRPWFALTRPARQLAALTPPLPALMAAPYVHRFPSQAALALGVADLVDMDPLAALESAASIGDPLLAAAVAHATMPVLMIAGKQDRIFPPQSIRALAAALPAAQLAMLDDCGHVPMVEQPTACYAALGGFLSA